MINSNAPVFNEFVDPSFLTPVISYMGMWVFLDQLQRTISVLMRDLPPPMGFAFASALAMGEFNRAEAKPMCK